MPFSEASLQSQPATNEDFASLLKKYTNSTTSKHNYSTLIYGTQLISRYSSKLGNGYANVLEQVYLCALCFGQQEWFRNGNICPHAECLPRHEKKWCYKELEKLHPPRKSERMQRLNIMAAEARGDWDTALTHYKKLLKTKPDDVLTRKRIVAIFLAQKKYAEGIDFMNRHLEEFCSDTETWHELAELYISQCWLDRALFCYEEMLIQNPQNFYTVVTCAELYYSLGQAELSRKYYCLALYLDGECIRALWGLILVLFDPYVDPSKSRSKASKAVASNDTITTELFYKSVTKLEAIYTSSVTEKSKDSMNWHTIALKYLREIKASFNCTF